MEREASRGGGADRGWPRAAGLLGLVLATSILHPGVLLAAPLLFLLVWHGPRSFGVVVASTLAVLILVLGTRDGLWFAERAWAVLLGGWFLGVTLLVPRWGLCSRALGAVVGAAAVGGTVLATRADGWARLDALIGGSVRAGVDATLDGWALLSGGEALNPDLVATFREAAEAQATVFPALVFVESMAALGVVWWARTRLVKEGDQAIGPLREFRFNDHLVWVLVGGLLLLLPQLGDALARVGSNAVVFMGALYAMRGVAVVLFVTGGLSFFGWAMVAVGAVLVPALVVGLAVAVGIGDTWLDLRARRREEAA